jgi:hypothetical protein
MPPGATVRVAPPEDIRQGVAEPIDRAQRSLDRLASGLLFHPEPSIRSIFHPPR